MLKRITALIIASLLVLTSVNVFAAGPYAGQDDIPFDLSAGPHTWPANRPDLSPPAIAHSADVATHGEIMNLAYWGKYLLVLHKKAIVVLDANAGYSQTALWKIDDITDPAFKQGGGKLGSPFPVAAVIDQKNIFILIAGTWPGGARILGYISVFENILESNPDGKTMKEANIYENAYDAGVKVNSSEL